MHCEATLSYSKAVGCAGPPAPWVPGRGAEPAPASARGPPLHRTHTFATTPNVQVAMVLGGQSCLATRLRSLLAGRKCQCPSPTWVAPRYGSYICPARAAILPSLACATTCHSTAVAACSRQEHPHPPSAYPTSSSPARPASCGPPAAHLPLPVLQIDLRFGSQDDGKLQVVVAPVLRFRDVGYNADVRLDFLGEPQKLIEGGPS